jgi:hypothetical protein
MSDEKDLQVKKLPGILSLLGQSFSIYRKYFSTFYSYSAWLLVPLVVSLLAFISFEKDLANLIDFIFNILIYSLLVTWLSIVFISLVPHLKKDRKINAASFGIDAWYLLIPFLIVGLVVSLINLLGFVLLIIPGLIFSTWLAFSGILVVLEKAQLSEAMKKSKAMVQGRTFAVFYRLYGGMFIIASMYLFTLIGADIIQALISGSDLQTALLSQPSILNETIYRLIEILVLPLVFIYQTLLYLELRKKA